MLNFRSIKQQCTKTLVIEFSISIILFVGGILLKSLPSYQMDIPLERKNFNATYPLVSETFPFLFCCTFSWCVPVIVIFYFAQKRNSAKYFITSITSFFFAVSLCLFLTNSFKLFAGKPRPNYYSLIDNKKASKVYQSFPSGHSSTTFNGMMFLTLLLCGEYKIFNGEGSILKLIGCCLPLLFGCIVAISRVRDYFHGYDDIIAGSLLGCVTALLCYVLKFKVLCSRNSGEIETEEYREFDDNYIV
ncbi:hypothetical protein ENUP19_0218G0026 [Entamoeba nuttalli]|uniref:Lipid phosphate phosphatase, putative n=2 Tax=Entamoeba nuttalli TaxID=412467 RepID=K2HUB6_ENTNP|nr:lipid phosphate phosphatase, putative [Entamoeba nuttalli P19]EKE39795.1 lipid phosphate phosphatase, putative [Entamoeba nuttalli P19]|eukprot:XP_008857874.1 lipid phosphate phosphatase, putative [Entamoeba nuttalli P19]